MINYKNFYHIDDIVLSSFCPNTNKVPKEDKYIIFKNYLHSFHPVSLLYEDTVENFVAFIIYSILLNSLELNKNILAYEEYFYNVVNGFASKTGKTISASNIAKYWNLLVITYNDLIEETTSPSVKEVQVLQKGHSTLRFINFDKVNNNFYWDIPIRVYYEDGRVRNILIIPLHKTSAILSNYLVLHTIANYSNNSLSLISISLDKIMVKYSSVNLTDTVKSFATQYVEKSYVDFSTANISNCTICPVAPCTTEQMFKVVGPTTKKTQKIQLVNT